jgi:hypothetical protein
MMALPINPRISLVNSATVRAKHGCDAGRVSQFVDSGKYIWVFNLARQAGRVRDLRFWVSEMLNPSAVAGLSLEEVIKQILPPSRSSFPSGEICLRFMISKPSLGRIRREMGIGLGVMDREKLAGFLRLCWLGDENSMNFSAKKPHSGRGGSPIVSSASVETFPKGRKL